MNRMNFVASLALLIWPFVTLLLVYRLRLAVAVASLLMSGMLFLPERVAFDFPFLPPFDKWLIPSLWAFLACLVFAPRTILSARPGRGPEALVLVLAACALPTMLSNREALVHGVVAIPGMSVHDTLSLATKDLLYIGLPFLLGRSVFRSSRSLRVLMTAIVVAGLVYSLFILYEFRMAPRLHREIYGFHQHSFAQTLRWGGYRPMVFMPHGLALALFVLTTSIAATAMYRARRRLFGVPTAIPALYLSVVLVMCRSFGAIIYGALLLPLAWLAKPRRLAQVAMLLGVFVMAYPIIRLAEVFPTGALVDLASRVDVERARSLAGRFDNEEALLEKSRQRLLFGWGSWGRWRLYDPETGRDLTVSDGYWTIQIGSRGLVGFWCVCGLLLWPVVGAQRRLSRIRSPVDRALLSGLSLIVAVSALDLLPNGFLSSFLIFEAGALAGLVPGIAREESAALRAEREQRRNSEDPREASRDVAPV